jgi:hypothetical protein
MSEPDPRDSAHPMMDTKIANGNPAPEAKLKDSQLNKSPVHIKTSPLGIYTLFTEVTTLGGLLPGYDPCSNVIRLVLKNLYVQQL